MSMDSQLYNMLCEYIYGNVCLTLEIVDDFLLRGNQDGWPRECWTYMVRVLVIRDLLRLALTTLGDVPVLGAGGSVASAWNTREYVRTGGGREGRMGDGETDDLSGGGLGGQGGQGLSGGGLGGDVDSVG